MLALLTFGGSTVKHSLKVWANPLALSWRVLALANVDLWTLQSKWPVLSEEKKWLRWNSSTRLGSTCTFKQAELLQSDTSVCVRLQRQRNIFTSRRTLQQTVHTQNEGKWIHVTNILKTRVLSIWHMTNGRVHFKKYIIQYF